MPIQHLLHPTELTTLVREHDFVLIAMLVPGLQHSALVQGYRNHVMSPTVFVIYREGGMTFEAIAAIEPGDQRAGLDDVLTKFVEGECFHSTIVKPMMAAIARHFCRPLDVDSPVGQSVVDRDAPN